ncbi:MAG TPA: MnhB domain-containing protein [Pseudolabrys sp.]|nr:MnhB domain-containing protein [Pseudolabrys sp.]
MSRHIRSVAFVVMALILVPFIVAGLSGLPAFGNYPGPYGDIINAIGTPVRHITNMVTGVNYDFRGLDTLGEEFILFASVTGIVMLLRGARGEAKSADALRIEHRRREGRSEAVMGAGRLLAPITLLYGIYVVLHAQITPGGGFQGGVIVFGAVLLAYLGEGYSVWRHVAHSTVLDLTEALGAGIYVIGGLIPMFFGARYLQNILPLGETKTITSGGLIPIINFGVGLAVAAGFLSIALELLEETRATGGDGS